MWVRLLKHRRLDAQACPYVAPSVGAFIENGKEECHYSIRASHFV